MGIINLTSPFGYGLQNGDYIDFAASGESSDTLIVLGLNNYIPIRTVKCPKCKRYAWEHKGMKTYIHRVKVERTMNSIQFLDNDKCSMEELT